MGITVNLTGSKAVYVIDIVGEVSLVLEVIQTSLVGSLTLTTTVDGVTNKAIGYCNLCIADYMTVL